MGLTVVCRRQIKECFPALRSSRAPVPEKREIAEGNLTREFHFLPECLKTDVCVFVCGGGGGPSYFFWCVWVGIDFFVCVCMTGFFLGVFVVSEELRVGTECRSRGSPYL